MSAGSTLFLLDSAAVLDHAVRHLPHRLAQVHRRLLNPAERFRLAQSQPGLQQALRSVNGLARLQPLVQVAHLGLDRLNLGEAGPRHLDGRDQVGLAEGLDDVRHRPRLGGPVDQVPLAEGGQHLDRVETDQHLVLGHDDTGLRTGAGLGVLSSHSDTVAMLCYGYGTLIRASAGVAEWYTRTAQTRL